MKRLLIAMLAVTLLLVGCAPSRSYKLQEPVVSHDYSLPPISFTIKDIVDVLTEYQVRAEADSWACNYQYYGYTDFKSKTIYLCTKYDLGDRRNTMIHEILHVLYHYRGIDTGGPYEFAIGQHADRIANELYGLPKLDATQDGVAPPVVLDTPASP